MQDNLAQMAASVRRVLDDSDLAAPEQASWEQLVELGWLLVPIPEDLEGLDFGIPGACVLLMELGRRLAAVPFLPAMLTVDALCQSNWKDRKQWLEGIIGGKHLATPLAECAIQVEQQRYLGMRLNGVAKAVQSANDAKYILVWSEESARIVLVSLAQPQVEVVSRRTWDSTRRFFDVRFDEAPCPARFVIAEGAHAKSLARRLRVFRDFALAADSLGGAIALLEMINDHLITRRQFGRPLALFQALKHRCADLKMLTVSAEATLWENLGRLGRTSDSSEAAKAALATKYLACAAYGKVAEEALQLYGGMAMAVEHPCHLFFKRAMLNRQIGHAEDCCEIKLADAFLAN